MSRPASSAASFDLLAVKLPFSSTIRISRVKFFNTLISVSTTLSSNSARVTVNAFPSTSSSVMYPCVNSFSERSRFIRAERRFRFFSSSCPSSSCNCERNRPFSYASIAIVAVFTLASDSACVASALNVFVLVKLYCSSMILVSSSTRMSPAHG